MPIQIVPNILNPLGKITSENQDFIWFWYQIFVSKNIIMASVVCVSVHPSAHSSLCLLAYTPLNANHTYYNP